MQKELSHTDDMGKARMVNVGHKPVVSRAAIAVGTIRLNKKTIKLIKDNNIKKGDVLTVAEIAGVQAAKKTYELIPLCHQLLLSSVEVHTTIESHGVMVEAKAYCSGKTGVEMEALTAVSVALLTIYDMCKAVDNDMIISDVKLLDKSKDEGEF